MVDGNVAINLSDVFYRDRPQEADFISIPCCDPNPQLDNGWSLGAFLGGLIKPQLGFLDDGTPSGGLSSQALLDSSTCDTTDSDAQIDAPAQREALEDEDGTCDDDCPPEDGMQDAIGFQGVFFRHVLSGIT